MITKETGCSGAADAPITRQENGTPLAGTPKFHLGMDSVILKEF